MAMLLDGELGGRGRQRICFLVTGLNLAWPSPVLVMPLNTTRQCRALLMCAAECQTYLSLWHPRAKQCLPMTLAGVHIAQRCL